MLSNEVNDDIASLIVSQLLFLESQDPTKGYSFILTVREEVSVPVLQFMTQ